MVKRHKNKWFLLILWVFLAFLMLTDKVVAQATDTNDVVQAIARIKGCDINGCDRGLGSGAIIHPSGLILTARHVTQNDPLNPNSGFLDDFVIEMTDNARSAPIARYRAVLAATSDADTDLALLWIYWDEKTGSTISPGSLSDLPFLKLGDGSIVDVRETVQVLGYPLAGGAAINWAEEKLSGFFDEDGSMFKVSASLSEGNSGGPVLIERNGDFQVVGVVIRRRGSLGEVGLIRNIDTLRNLTWTPSALRVWSDPMIIETDGNQLQFSTTIHAVDFDQHPLRLISYAFDASQPRRAWVSDNPRLATSSGQLVINFEPSVDGRLVINQPVQFILPLSDIGAELGKVVFKAILWNPEANAMLWQDNRLISISPVASIAQSDVQGQETQLLANTPESTSTDLPPPPTNTVASTLTATQTKVATSTLTVTPDVAALVTANAQAFATSVAATLTALPTNTPTPTSTKPPTPELVANALMNVRTGPGTNYTVIGSASAGDRYIVTGRNADSSWWEIEFEGRVGWVFGALVAVTNPSLVPLAVITPSPPTNTPVVQVQPSQCVIAISNSVLTNWDANLGCPTQPSSIIWATYTRYERGFMMWRSDTDLIYGFFDVGYWQEFENNFSNSMPDKPVPGRGEAPPGLFHPIRGTGLIWANDDTVFGNLGWAEMEQRGFCAELQSFDNGFIIRESGLGSCQYKDESLTSMASNPIFDLDFVSANNSGTWRRN